MQIVPADTAGAHERKMKARSARWRPAVATLMTPMIARSERVSNLLLVESNDAFIVLVVAPDSPRSAAGLPCLRARRKSGVGKEVSVCGAAMHGREARGDGLRARRYGRAAHHS